MSLPAYFLSMTLAQVRCFGPEQTLDLRDEDGRPARWTIILGENGVGKTTLLQCLCAIRPPFRRAAGTVLDAANRWYFDAHELMRRVGAEDEMLVRAECVVTTDMHAVPRADQCMQIRETSAPRRGRTTELSRSDASMFCCAYGASRRPGRTALASEPMTDAARSLYDEDAPLVDVEEWFLQADYARSRGGARAESRFQRVREILLRLLPNVDELRVSGLELHPPQPVVELQTPYGWVRPHQLSLGYRTLLAWVVDLAHQMFARYPDSEDPLAEPVVVLVDEIDLHLHPRWQRDLTEFLGQRFPHAQFIVTAHSPLIVQAAPDANLVVVRRENGDDHVTIHNDPAAVRGWRVDQILTSDLFGLESARPPAQERLLVRRRELLRNDRRGLAEDAELQALDESLAQLPKGDTASDVEAWDIIRRFAERLREEDKGAAE